MTQRIFDIENKKDYTDLWDIVPEEINRIERFGMYFRCYNSDKYITNCCLIKINWHDKTEITRPIQEVTKADIGKLCYFWNDDDYFYGKLDCILNGRGVRYSLGNGMAFNHCRRLTKQEIEELC